MHVSEQQFLQKFRRLPPDKQEEILHLVEEIEENTPKKPRRNPIGLCADLGISISAEEIDQARREMWGNFPRDDF